MKISKSVREKLCAVSLARSGAGMFTFFAAISMAGCSISEPPVITATSGRILAGDIITLVSSDSAQKSQASFESALVQAFSKSGLSIGENGETIADFSISTNRADATLYVSEAGAAAPAPTAVVNVRKPSFLDNCTAVRTRVKVVAFSRKTGDLIASTEAEAISCEGEAPPYQELADLVVGRLSE